jgi:hypothetical protein
VLLIAGDHVPDMPLVEVVGNAEIVVPEQYGPTGSNVGVVFDEMVNVPLAEELEQEGVVFVPTVTVYVPAMAVVKLGVLPGLVAPEGTVQV